MLISFFLIVLFFSCNERGVAFRSLFSLPTFRKIYLFEVIFTFDKISLIFLYIVLMVTSLVTLYSEHYIEGYNNKKFLLIMILFFGFIRILSLSRDFLTFLIGWDGLGISSLFLIIFYPNKVTLFNSFLTLRFNRLGDIFLILLFCLLFPGSPTFFFILEEYQDSVMFIFLLCLLTKRAQIPFSSWLPAAISAPTPISAMVHSSTLVTAGLLVFFKITFYFQVWGLVFFLICISGVTFLMGGILGRVEKDLKKVVAFSTISQIRMIIFFFSLGFLTLALSHTLCHALFKTLLFCGCGIMFTLAFRDQLSSTFRSFKGSTSLFYLIHFRIFGMRGLIFSSSFFTKDTILESLFSSNYCSLFLTLLVGRVFTLVYRGTIMYSLSTTIKDASPIKRLSPLIVIFIPLFRILTISSMKFWKLLLGRSNVFLPRAIVLSLNLFFLYTLLKIFIPHFKILLFLRGRVFNMKESFFSSFAPIYNSKPLILLRNEQYLFKPSLLFRTYFNTQNFRGLKFLAYTPILWGAAFLVYSFSLIWTWYWSYQGLRIILNLEIENLKCFLHQRIL